MGERRLEEVVVLPREEFKTLQRIRYVIHIERVVPFPLS
jgi:hypothetical protein